MKFNCTKCGACCVNVGKTVDALLQRDTPITNPGERLMLEFPFGFKEDKTTCEMYDPAIGCTIYETRPLICNASRMKLLYMEHYGWTEQEYYKFQAQSCNILIILAELPFTFLIHPGKEAI